MVAPVLILLAIMSYGGYAIAEGLRVGGRSGIFPLALGVALVALTALGEEQPSLIVELIVEDSTFVDGPEGVVVAARGLASVDVPDAPELRR